MKINKLNTFYIVFCALTAGIGGFLFGYDTAVINGANTYLQKFFMLDSQKDAFLIGLATASAIIGCIPGALAAGFLSDKFGRKKMLFASAVLFSISAIWSANPGTFGLFIVARFIGGLGIGIASNVCPVYIAELSPPKYRGFLGTLFQMGIVLGIFITLFINKEIQGAHNEIWNLEYGWRWMLRSEIIPAGIFIMLLFAVAESPRWLIQAGKMDKAENVLKRIGGESYAAQEISEVELALKGEKGTLRDLFSSKYRTRLIIAVVIMAASQFSGINAIMYYSTNIFEQATGDANAAYNSSVWIGVINFAATFIALFLVDFFGRKPLLLIGAFFQVVSLTAVGILFKIGALSSVLLLVFILVYIAAFALALGPIPWIFCSELFPNKLRGRAMSVATFAIWVGCLIVSLTFPPLQAAAGADVTFWIFAGCSAAAFIFILFVIPETKGKSLEDLEEFFDKKAESNCSK